MRHCLIRPAARSSCNPYNPLLGGSRHSLIAIYSCSDRDRVAYYSYARDTTRGGGKEEDKRKCYSGALIGRGRRQEERREERGEKKGGI